MVREVMWQAWDDLTHDRLDGLRDRYPHIAEHVEPGWESALGKLVTVGW